MKRPVITEDMRERLNQALAKNLMPKLLEAAAEGVRAREAEEARSWGTGQ